jgi:pimeloyl-ACP methyl ester carboxylesterase
MWQHHGVERPPAERWIEVPSRGIAVRVLDTGGDGRPILFIHGGPNAGSTWAPLAGRLPGIRALALDRPGCGLSPALPATDELPWPAMVEVQAAVIEALVGGPVDVVGSSFGGGCALSLAAARPELVRRLVLEGVPTVEGMRLANNLRILAAGPIGRFIARQRASIGDVRRTFRQLGHGRLVADGWPEGADAAWGLSMMNDTATMKHEVALIQRAASVRGFRRGTLVPTETLTAVAARTLWLWGSADPFGRAEQGRAWAAAMPDARFELLADSGHLPWLDDPDLHARLIGEFLA